MSGVTGRYLLRLDPLDLGVARYQAAQRTVVLSELRKSTGANDGKPTSDLRGRTREREALAKSAIEADRAFAANDCGLDGPAIFGHDQQGDHSGLREVDLINRRAGLIE